jgi:hypothetical protein
MSFAKSVRITPAHNPGRPTYRPYVGRSGLWTGILLLVSQTPLLACPVCFQIDDGHTAAGVRAAVWVLLGVTGLVLGGFAVFVRRLVRRP